jgi:hypothetical protein
MNTNGEPESLTKQVQPARKVALKSEHASARADVPEATNVVSVRAVLVGINAYEAQPLEGCLNDVHDMHEWLKAGVPANRLEVRALTEQGATRSKILQAIDWLLDGAADAQRLFHYSGHGAQIPGDRELDGIEEVICPIDFAWTVESSITTAALEKALTASPRGNTTIVLDCCYAAGLDRNLHHVRASVRAMIPPPSLRIAARRFVAGRRTMARSLSDHSLCLPGAAEGEAALDGVFQGRRNGLFTRSLLDELKRGPDDSAQSVIVRVNRAMDPYSQHAAAIGLVSRLAAPVLLRGPISPSMPDETGALHREVQMRAVDLAGGDFAEWRDRVQRRAVSIGDRMRLPRRAALVPPTARGRGANSDWLHVDEQLVPGQRLVSADGTVRLEFQTDGNLVIYADDMGQTFVRWASNTSGQPAANVVMQGDGNLVMYSHAGAPLWSSNTWQHPGTELVLQDDENLVLYQNGNAVWATDTWTIRTPLQNMHCYANYRPDVDWNTCGQAAIASMLDFWHTHPFAIWKTLRGTDGRFHWHDGEAIDAVKAAGFPADVVFGWGTTPGRIAAALTTFGLPSEVSHAGMFGIGGDQVWRRLQEYLSNGFPVPVLVDVNVFGGPLAGYHWPVAYKIDHGRVYLGNCPWNPSPTIDEFLRSWACSLLPVGFNFAAVFRQRTSQVADRRCFDPQVYLETYGDLSAAFGSDYGRARQHWIDNGIGEGRRASLLLDPPYYLSSHGDLVSAFGSGNYGAAIEHFIAWGAFEGRRTSLEFDVKWYLSNHADLVAAFGATNYEMAIEHFIIWGLGEGRRASADFDVGFYLNHHGDLISAFGAGNYPAAFRHWLAYGKGEGRQAVP